MSLIAWNRLQRLGLILSSNPVLKWLSNRFFWMTFFAFQSAKLFMILTCVCLDPSQPFNSWFFVFASHMPYTFWYVYHGYSFLATPYSGLWYTFYQLTRFGYYPYYLTTYAMDWLFLIVVLKNHSRIYTLYYLELSAYFLIVDPVDLLIFWFIVLGRIKPFFLILAIATKFPLIPPVLDPGVWNFIFFSQNSIQDPNNWNRYAVLGFAFSLSIALYLHDKRKRIKSSGDRKNTDNYQDTNEPSQHPEFSSINSSRYFRCFPSTDKNQERNGSQRHHRNRTRIPVRRAVLHLHSGGLWPVRNTSVSLACQQRHQNHD